MQVGHDQQTSANCKSKLRFGLDKQFSTLVLKFNKIFSISSGNRQTEYKFPTCIKPCSLCGIIKNDTSENKKYTFKEFQVI
jgi:hypothetical protein